MNNQPTSPKSLLAGEFSKRIAQLGISRRQLTQRTGLSRQTLHNIEHGNSTDLKPATTQALDKALYWRMGTCVALLNGDASALQESDTLATQDKVSTIRWEIVERMQRMSLPELERMVSLMEGEAFGQTDEPRTTEDVISIVEAKVMERLAKQSKAGLGNPTGDKREKTA